MSKVFSVFSGKGGVGKTTFTARFGKFLSSQGMRTLLVDGDWTLGKLGVHFGASPQWTFESVLTGKVSLSSAVHSLGKNLDLLAAPSGMLGWEELPAEIVQQIFYELDGLQEQYDYVLIDHASGIGMDVTQIAAASHFHLALTTPDASSYLDAYAIMKILHSRFGVRQFLLCLSMIQDEEHDLRGVERFSAWVEEQLGVRIACVGAIPWSRAIAMQQRDGRMETALATIFARVARSQVSLRNGIQFFYQPDTTVERGLREFVLGEKI